MVFDRIFKMFKSNKGGSSVDYTVKDIKKGYILEYDLKNWEAIEEFEYDWGGNYKGKEWTLFDGKDEVYLYYASFPSEEISVSTRMNMLRDLPELRKDVFDNDEPRTAFEFNGKKWNIVDESPGLMINTETKEEVEVVSWTFDDQNESEFISIVRNGEKSCDAYQGKYIKNYEVSDILPREAE